MRIPAAYLNLPSPLLLLVFSILAQTPSPSLAQAPAGTLQPNKITGFSINSTQKTIFISLPQTTQPIVLSVELCTQLNGQQPPRFFVAANTGNLTPPPPSGTQSSASPSSTAGVIVEDGEVDVGTGLGIWNSSQSLVNGRSLNVELDPAIKSGTWSFRVGISTNS